MASKIVYMFYDTDATNIGGPYLGEPGFDPSSFVAEFRADAYAKAEEKREDYCYTSDSDFIAWLLEKGIVTVIESERLTLDSRGNGEDKYVPKHWPLCPECAAGRGQEEGGDLRSALNRREWYFVCTNCSHHWGHHDEPYDSRKPMLEDDGRYVEAGCVPYAISKVCEVPFDEALMRCKEKGWSSRGGMHSGQGLAVVRELGLIPLPWDEFHTIDGKPTIKRVLQALERGKNYIVAIKGHWLPIVQGHNLDPAESSLRAEVEHCWEVVR